MSHPPTNSPSTYSCGMVGQLLSTPTYTYDHETNTDQCRLNLKTRRMRLWGIHVRELLDAFAQQRVVQHVHRVEVHAWRTQACKRVGLLETREETTQHSDH